MFATEREEERSVLNHTSKGDYFLNSQKDVFDDIVFIYSILTLQRLFIFFKISSSQKP